MQVYLYRFNVKPGCDDQFKSAWHDVTECIFKERGSLGSRLHISAKNEYIAYAQWPSFDVAKTRHSPSAEYRAAFDRLQASLASSEVLFELDVLDDLLRSEFPGR